MYHHKEGLGPDERRCIVCGVVAPFNAFTQFKRGSSRVIPGWVDTTGRFNRGYEAVRTQSIHLMRCADCRKSGRIKRALKRRFTKKQHTYSEVMKQISLHKRRSRDALRTSFSKAHTTYETMRREYLAMAASRARLRRTLKKPMPFRIRRAVKDGVLTKVRFVRWQYLLTQQERDHLRHLYGGVYWRNGAPDLF